MQKILTLLATLSFSAIAVADDAALLVYKVQDPDAEPYFSRVLVTDDYVRLDEGLVGQGFTLLNRSEGIIYNVSDEDNSVLLMEARDQKIKKQDTLMLSDAIQSDDEAPKIKGKTVQQVKLFANGDTCGEMVTVPGLLPKAVDAMREFKLVLAKIQAAIQEKQPLDSDSACDLASNIYAAGRAWQYGLPIQENAGGRSQSLIDFRESTEIDGKLFEVPAEYTRMNMDNVKSF